MSTKKNPRNPRKSSDNTGEASPGPEEIKKKVEAVKNVVNWGTDEDIADLLKKFNFDTEVVINNIFEGFEGKPPDDWTTVDRKKPAKKAETKPVRGKNEKTSERPKSFSKELRAEPRRDHDRRRGSSRRNDSRRNSEKKIQKEESYSETQDNGENQKEWWTVPSDAWNPPNSQAAEISDLPQTEVSPPTSNLSPEQTQSQSAQVPSVDQSVEQTAPQTLQPVLSQQSAPEQPQRKAQAKSKPVNQYASALLKQSPQTPQLQLKPQVPQVPQYSPPTPSQPTQDSQPLQAIQSAPSQPLRFESQAQESHQPPVRSDSQSSVSARQGYHPPGMVWRPKDSQSSQTKAPVSQAETQPKVSSPPLSSESISAPPVTLPKEEVSPSPVKLPPSSVAAIDPKLEQNFHFGSIGVPKKLTPTVEQISNKSPSDATSANPSQATTQSTTQVQPPTPQQTQPEPSAPSQEDIPAQTGIEEIPLHPGFPFMHGSHFIPNYGAPPFAHFDASDSLRTTPVIYDTQAYQQPPAYQRDSSPSNENSQRFPLRNNPTNYRTDKFNPPDSHTPPMQNSSTQQPTPFYGHMFMHPYLQYYQNPQYYPYYRAPFASSFPTTSFGSSSLGGYPEEMAHGGQDYKAPTSLFHPYPYVPEQAHPASKNPSQPSAPSKPFSSVPPPSQNANGNNQAELGGTPYKSQHSYPRSSELPVASSFYGMPPQQYPSSYYPNQVLPQSTNYPRGGQTNPQQQQQS